MRSLGGRGGQAVRSLEGKGSEVLGEGRQAVRPWGGGQAVRFLWGQAMKSWGWGAGGEVPGEEDRQ